MGFVISLCILASATLISQTGMVGQTTAEEVVLKEQIRDVRALVGSLPSPSLDNPAICEDVRMLALARWNAVVDYSAQPAHCNEQGYEVRTVSLWYTDRRIAYREVLDVAAEL